LEKIEAYESLIGHEWNETDLGNTPQQCAAIVGHIQADVVMQNIEGVATGNGLIDLFPRPIGIDQLAWTIPKIMAAVGMELGQGGKAGQGKGQG